MPGESVPDVKLCCGRKYTALSCRACLICPSWLLLHRRFLKHFHSPFCFYLQSFADSTCSGLKTCQLEVYRISSYVVKTQIQPCPVELVSYAHAGYHCIQGFSLILISSLHSFADLKCSGQMRCHLDVYQIVKSGIRPCPLELSSYLQAQSTCVQGI